MTLAATLSHASAGLALSTTPDPCVGVGLPLPAPQVVGYSSDPDPLTSCELPLITTPNWGWCGTHLCVNDSLPPHPFIFTIANSGPGDLSGVVVSYTLPTNAVFQAAAATQGTVAQQIGMITFNLGLLNVGEQAQLALNLLPTSSTTIEHAFDLAADQALLNGGNATFSSSVNINSTNETAGTLLVAMARSGSTSMTVATRVPPGPRQGSMTAVGPAARPNWASATSAIPRPARSAP
jgi:uncharacterized repeat protein (TIGR01451 family)